MLCPLTRSALPVLLPRATILAEREVRRMDYTNAMMVWDAVSVRITDVRHRLLIRQQVEEVDENSLFLFIFGKTGRIIVGERIYLLKTSALFHIGRNHSIFIDARDVLPEYQEAVAAMPFITEGLNSGTPNLETVLDQDPDFVLGTYYNFFPVNCGAPEDYEAAGANVYAQEGTYVAGATLENTYNDILNLGQIFHVEERARELVAEMRAQADEITTKLAETEPVSTFVYDSGEGTMLSIGGVGLENELLTLAGGANIFADQESRYFDASIENIIEANPSAIIVYDYSISADSEQKIEYLKSLSELSEVDAIKNDKIIVLPIYTVFPGMQNVRAIQLMAEGLHPELFE